MQCSVFENFPKTAFPILIYALIIAIFYRAGKYFYSLLRFIHEPLLGRRGQPRPTLGQ